jgi:hypothetical protein
MYSPIVTCWRHLRQFPNSRIHSTVIDHLPCNTHGGGTCRNTKWEIAISEKLLLSRVGNFIGISTIRNNNLLKTRLQGEKTKVDFLWWKIAIRSLSLAQLTHLSRTQTHGPIATIAGPRKS